MGIWVLEICPISKFVPKLTYFTTLHTHKQTDVHSNQSFNIHPLLLPSFQLGTDVTENKDYNSEFPLQLGMIMWISSSQWDVSNHAMCFQEVFIKRAPSFTSSCFLLVWTQVWLKLALFWTIIWIPLAKGSEITK